MASRIVVVTEGNWEGGVNTSGNGFGQYNGFVTKELTTEWLEIDSCQENPNNAPAEHKDSNQQYQRSSFVIFFIKLSCTNIGIAC